MLDYYGNFNAPNIYIVKKENVRKQELTVFQIERILAQHDPFHQIYIKKHKKNNKFLALYVSVYV